MAVAELAGKNEVPSLAGAALRCRGLAENDAEILHAAVSAYGQGSWDSRLPPRTRVRRSPSRATRTARGLLEQAVSIYERLDAAPRPRPR
jgi:hypothetical protein